jgi:hypothetical protein
VKKDDDIVEEVREDPHREIARLEAKIEDLADDIERCRKLALFSKVLAAGGALWLIAELFGVLRLGAPGAIGSLTAILGGFILGGSNRSTMLQAQGALDAAEVRRIELIGAIDLRAVNADLEPAAPPPSRLLH